ncbi:MAG: hypothetical protein HN729_06675 [Candidatus Marinimicrobia bacterium]|nr:hypothetical protein [Candidatus Neomarinimicrobiota bacterium]MBT3633694.1 hypothetical protein [Candidatus Neomarinimicrobiota bacterium]MBT3682353.1 hypothetical protein [Candidatus Neomarinimicrobiota bacterium]MBT3759117.1 hypothetical protein [Candidatus Neomarinimicrobiota bacterium]MBT3895610.1 hypothetical protein [Candidatus Neomarinimicrobiota bacterium]
MNLIRDILSGPPKDPRRTEMKGKTKKSESSQGVEKQNIQPEKVKNTSIKDVAQLTSSSKNVELGPVNTEKYTRLLKKMPDSSKANAVADAKVKIDSDAYSKSEVIHKIAEKILSAPVFRSPKSKNSNDQPINLQPANIKQIKSNVDDGNYDSDPVVDKIAESILKLFNRS